LPGHSPLPRNLLQDTVWRTFFISVCPNFVKWFASSLRRNPPLPFFSSYSIGLQGSPWNSWCSLLLSLRVGLNPLFFFFFPNAIVLEFGGRASLIGFQHLQQRRNRCVLLFMSFFFSPFYDNSVLAGDVILTFPFLSGHFFSSIFLTQALCRYGAISGGHQVRALLPMSPGFLFVLELDLDKTPSIYFLIRFSGFHLWDNPPRSSTRSG